MDGYRTVLVGTDGSPSSYRAVDQAAAQDDATLIVASAHIPEVETGHWFRAPSHDHVAAPYDADALAAEGYMAHGSAPI